jgi:hypothetical protein
MTKVEGASAPLARPLKICEICGPFLFGIRSSNLSHAKGGISNNEQAMTKVEGAARAVDPPSVNLRNLRTTLACDWKAASKQAIPRLMRLLRVAHAA